MAQVGPLCTCGAGYMKRYRANGKKNNGRYFYRYPQFKNQCKSFIWEDDLVGALGQETYDKEENKLMNINKLRLREDLGLGITISPMLLLNMDPIVELDNDNDINIDLDGVNMEIEGIDGPLSETGDESVGTGTLAKKSGNRKRKLTSHVWHFFEIFVGKNKKERAKCKKCGAIYLSISSHGIGNLSRHLKTCEKTTTRDLGQMLLSQSESFMSLRAAKFDPVVFHEMLNLAIIRHQLPFKFVEYEEIRDSKADDVVESAIVELAEELSLLNVGKNAHGVASDDVESPEIASNDGNGPSGSGACETMFSDVFVVCNFVYYEL
ncbi:hypothetical protein GIB67_016870 [Kingdonia uniflora]|uniref:BED-type domain-containing protein n=1 Tax=Kingdonia uniflora TaxID=39325 RepID=A0A7J7LQ59_9MAGN|nr:hypothetical protein GIB67_016870 [Kingdonia uniflora]